MKAVAEKTIQQQILEPLRQRLASLPEVKSHLKIFYKKSGWFDGLLIAPNVIL